jgi:hypothetical protein
MAKKYMEEMLRWILGKQVYSIGNGMSWLRTVPDGRLWEAVLSFQVYTRE